MYMDVVSDKYEFCRKLSFLQPSNSHKNIYRIGGMRHNAATDLSQRNDIICCCVVVYHLNCSSLSSIYHIFYKLYAPKPNL